MEERLLDLEKALEASAEQASRMETAYQAATKEIGEVKQRARALLEEKDTQLQAARVSTILTTRHTIAKIELDWVPCDYCRGKLQ